MWSVPVSLMDHSIIFTSYSPILDAARGKNGKYTWLVLFVVFEFPLFSATQNSEAKSKNGTDGSQRKKELSF